MKDIIRFIKDWMLVISMATGASAYLIYYNMPCLSGAGHILHHTITILQPVLLFVMLFLTFCRIDPKDMRPRKWHIWLLLFQSGTFIALAILLGILPKFHGGVLIESAMLCLICPTATAAAVVTGKLGGDMSGLTTYTIMINLVTAILVPTFVPVVHPVEGITFFTAFSMIMAKVFPLLIYPCLLAWIVRYAMPRLHRKIIMHENLAFYIWAFSLMLAILMTTRSIVHSAIPAIYQAGIAAVSLICCALQFWTGKKIGSRYGARVTAGQSLGQKNTVFAIWMGYTFMTPVTSVAGGFYSIWHNVYNSWQLYRKGHGRRQD